MHAILYFYVIFCCIVFYIHLVVIEFNENINRCKDFSRSDFIFVILFKIRQMAYKRPCRCFNMLRKFFSRQSKHYWLLPLFHKSYPPSILVEYLLKMSHMTSKHCLLMLYKTVRP